MIKRLVLTTAALTAALVLGDAPAWADSADVRSAQPVSATADGPDPDGGPIWWP